jgi:hypothetical protein
MLDSLLEMPTTDWTVYQSIVYHWTDVVRSSPVPVVFSDLEAFFPLHWKQWEDIFRSGRFGGDPASVRILHHYGYFSRRITSHMDAGTLQFSSSLFSVLARPVVAELAKVLPPLLAERAGLKVPQGDTTMS